MKILITGATGFIGRALVQRLLRDGHEVTAWVRSTRRGLARLGPEVDLQEFEAGSEALVRAVEQSDAVVNLAGASIMKRWTSSYRKELVSSRVALTRDLVRAVAAARRKPRVLVSASAVGIYDGAGSEWLDEHAHTGESFLARLCVAWEHAAQQAVRHGVRVATPRIGVVLGSDGGLLGSTLPLFERGLGGRIGNGQQYLPWVHLSDLVEMLVSALEDERIRGPFNAVAPNPVTNTAFTRRLADTLGTRAPFPVPALALRLVLGGAASVALNSHRVRPYRLLNWEFPFRYRYLSDALDAVVSLGRSVDILPAPEVPRVFEAAGKPQYILAQRTTINAPIDEVFDFFSKPQNLGLITPSFTSFQILPPDPGPMREGAKINYRIGLGPIPMRWTSTIEAWEPEKRFVDRQVRGPYNLWWHEHRFTGDGNRTHMEDWVYYAVPGGPIGRILHRYFVGPALRRIFGYRSEAMRFRFRTVESRAHRAA